MFVPQHETKKAMSESMKKNSLHAQVQKYNRSAVDTLSVKYQFSKAFIRQCLRGDRTSLTALKIKDEYKEITKDLDSVISRHKNQIIK